MPARRPWFPDQRSTLVIMLGVGAPGLVVASMACDLERPGFECGTPSELDEHVVQRCTRADEVCVCATRSCAVAEPQGTSDRCSSGYRYVGQPFADATLAGECVLDDHVPQDDEDGSGCEPRSSSGSSASSGTPESDTSAPATADDGAATEGA